MCSFTDTKMKKPCIGCPFGRVNNNEKPAPGGSHPFVYLGQARGPFWLPCHMDREYSEQNKWNTANIKQCAGAAIFRENCGKTRRMPTQLLDLPADHELVFSNEGEFYSYYSEMPLHDAHILLTESTLDSFMFAELEKTEAKRLS